MSVPHNQYHAAFTARFRSILRSGTLIFKSTRYREWYTERLTPFVDYIPVNYNLTDLPEKIEWAYQHPELANNITRHANEISSRFLRLEDMRCYVYRLMLEYQMLFEA
jgi:Glycosyl transferase family 90